MDLLLRVGILIVIIVVIVAGAIALTSHYSAPGPITQSEALNTVLSDAQQANPGANVTVIYPIKNSTIEANSWVITLSVVYNGTKPCPTLSIEDYDYPATQLSPYYNNLYTEHCTIYGLGGAPNYVVSSPYIAIARAYGSNVSYLTNYVSDYGLRNVNVYAKFYSAFNSSATTLGTNALYTNIWLINFTSTLATYNQYVILSQSGGILANYTEPRP